MGLGVIHPVLEPSAIGSCVCEIFLCETCQGTFPGTVMVAKKPRSFG